MGQADTYETQRLIRDELDEPQARVACIGLAGENGLPFASILSDHGRLAARTGMGALMGSKNLKALAVRGAAGAQTCRWPGRMNTAGCGWNPTRRLLEQNMTAVMHETGTSGAGRLLAGLGRYAPEVLDPGHL